MWAYLNNNQQITSRNILLLNKSQSYIIYYMAYLFVLNISGFLVKQSVMTVTTHKYSILVVTYYSAKQVNALLILS